MSNFVVPKYTSLPCQQGVELGRLVLLDDCEANAESWFVSRAFCLLKRKIPDVKAVVSFSDPVPRWAGDSRLIKPGHIGICYQALNARYMGRTDPRFVTVAADGRVVSHRTLSKLRNGESGADGAYRMLCSMGAPRRLPFEDAHKYVERALAEGPFRRFKHAGNHVYVWAVGNRTVRKAVTSNLHVGLPYPKSEALPL